jgi:hypothetical protein
MKLLLIPSLTSIGLLLATVASAQTPIDAEGPPASRRWGFEIDTVQPFIPTVGIVRPKLTGTLWGSPTGLRGDAIVGAYLRPHVEHDVLFNIDEYMATVGYRQYFWRGFHAETMLSAGNAQGTNRFDGKYYRTPTLFGDLNVGYRLGFFERGGIIEGHGGPVGFFLTPQAGVIAGLGVADIGPRNGKPDVFFQANLLIGASF